jgi:small subunit ribosomal protein S27e
MVKKRQEIIPRPKSSFIKVRCIKCTFEQITFDHATTIVRCKNCNEILLIPTGGKAIIKGEIVAKYG